MNSVVLNLTDKKEIEKWCQVLNCDESTLRFCIQYVGPSIVCVEAFLSMNRDWIMKRNNSAENKS